MMEEQDNVMGYQNISVVLEGGKEILMSDADLNINKLSEDICGDED